MAKSNNPDKSFFALNLAWRLGYMIAVPLVVFALVGRVLDKKLGTAPWLLLAGILVSVSISAFAVYKEALKVIGNEDREDKAD